MTNRELSEKLGQLVRSERRITNEILQIINTGLDRRAYLELGFSSMFDWLVRGFGYSNAAAYRRIQAARLLKVVPDLSKKIQSGQVNLTTVAKAQSIIQSQEKMSGTKLAQDLKIAAVKCIESRSSDDAERALLNLFPDVASSVHREVRTVVNSETTRHSFNLSVEVENDLKRAKELLSHQFPNASDADVFTYALRFLLKKVDPLTKSTSGPEAGRVTKSSSRRDLIRRSVAKCTFKDPVSGRVCGSRYQMQIDHIHAKAFGGSDEPENLRTYCRQHNLLHAEYDFGRSLMKRYRNHGQLVV